MDRIGAGVVIAHVRKLGDHAAAHLEDAIAAAARELVAKVAEDVAAAEARKAKEPSRGK